MLVLNLAVWVLGAELLYPDRHIEHLEDLPNLLSNVLGEPGRLLFYAGIFSAIYTSIIGHAAGLGSLGTHAWLRMRGRRGPDRHRFPPASLLSLDRRRVPDPAADLDPARHARVRGADARRQQRAGVLLPLLAGGLWWITASSRLIGREYRNRWWENAVMAVLFALADVLRVSRGQGSAAILTGRT